MNQHKTIITPVALADQIRTLAATWPGGEGMFQTGLSPDGKAPPTHFVSSGMIDEAIADALTSGATLQAVILQANPESTATVAELQAIIDVCDVSTGSPWDRFAALGLELVKTEEL